MDLTKARKAKALHSQGKSAQSIAQSIQSDLAETKHLITAGYAIELQERIGVPVDGRPWSVTMGKVYEMLDADPCPPTLPDGSSSEIVSPTAQTLGQRALDWCLREAKSWGDKQVSDERLADYLRGCERDGSDALGRWLAGVEESRPGRDFSFCAAAQGCAEDRSQLPGESMPPWRAGALELMRDAVDGKRPGERWLPLPELIDSNEIPPPGSIAVYENTAGDGRGHVERVIDATATGYRSVGANENDGRWVVDASPISYSAAGKTDGWQRLRLLGFVVPA